MSIINDISDALQRGKKKEVTKLVQQAIDEGIDATRRTFKWYEHHR